MMRNPTDHDMPVSHCTACGKQVNAALNIKSELRPDPGDITVCIDCGHVMVFADDMSLRNPTAAEMYDIAGNEELLTAQRMLADMKKEREKLGKDVW